MKDKLLLLKSDLQKLHNYDNDKVELKRIINKLQMYIDVLFPNESDDWHSMIFHINFTPAIVTYGLGNFAPGTDNGEFQQGIQQLSDIIDLVIEKMELVNINSNTTDYDTICNNKKIFIVHGHDNEVKESVARVLQQVGLEPIILNEQSNSGKTIIEKLEHYGDVGFAVILLTPCDIGKANTESEYKERARQNVIAELGYFIGRLGRNHVSIIHRGNTEIPSDFKGLGYISFDDKSWKYDLAKELKSAGYDIDINKLL